MILALLVAPRLAAADDVTGVVFVAQPVRGPVALDQVSPVLPFTPSTAEHTGPSAVGPDRAVALWLDANDVVRVRQDRTTAQLRFARVVGDVGGKARIDEPGAQVAAGTTYLAQPPGRGDAWIVYADKPATVRIERPVARDGRMIWEGTQGDVLAWIDRGGPRPTLPVSDGAFGAVLALDAEATIGAALEAAFPTTKKAVRAWRKAGAIAQLSRVRPMVEPQLALTQLDGLAGMAGDVTVPDPTVPDPRPYQRVANPKPMTVELEGPGVLRVEVRAILPPITTRQLEPPTVTVAVTGAGQQLGKRSVAAAYATMPDPVQPPPAFPIKDPLRSAEGDYLGDRVAVAIATFPGKHTYTINLEGGALAVRATAARRKVRMGEWLSGSDDVDHFVRDAYKALGSDASDGANLVRHLLALRSGAARPTAAPAGKLSPLLGLAWLVAAGKLDDGDAIRASLAALPATSGPEVWALVLELARRLRSPDQVRALYRAVRGAPPPSLVPELAELLPRSTPLERVRNWSLAAVDGAARARPIDPAVANAARAEWRTGEWGLIFPTFRDPDAEPPQPIRWLAETKLQPMIPPRGWQPGDLTRLEPGKLRAVTALPSAIDATRAALLEVYLATPPGDPGPVQVTVDGKPFHALALAPVERLQFAVPPGKHEVSITGPKGLRGWVSQMPIGAVGPEDTARVWHYWPTEVDGARLQYVLPAGDLPIPVEIALRAVGTAGKPIHVTINSDVGRPLELELAPRAADAKAYGLDVAAQRQPAVDETRFVLRLPPGARTVWLETTEPGRVFAAVSARREHVQPDLAAAPAAPPAGDLVERVTMTSKALGADPFDAHARARRASDLLDLGEIGLAREDLVKLLRVPGDRRDNSLAAVEEELFTRLDNFGEPTHVALVGGAQRDPLPIAPGLLAVAADGGLAKWKAAATALRTKGADEALRTTAGSDDPVATYIAARAYQLKGDDASAAQALIRIYQRTDRWPIGFDALDVLARLLTDRKRPPRAGLISLTYGIATRVRLALDHPRLRRALVVAAAQSGWDTVTSTSSNAGQEHLFSSAPLLPPAPAVVVREALLSPKWPVRSAHTLTAGNSAVLDLTVPSSTAVRTQIHCVRVRAASPTAEGPCSLTARLDNGAARPINVPPNTTTDLALEPLSSGRHVVEVALAEKSEGDVASVRFVSERALVGLTAPAEASGQFPIKIERRAKVFVGAAATPITVTLLGPATIWVQARGIDPGAKGPSAVEVLATPKKGDPIKALMPLARERDADARGDAGRDLVVSPPVDAFLVLPDAGPYTISVRPDRGELISRMALRDERKGKVPRLPGPWYLAAPPSPPAFALPTPPAASTVAGVDFAAPATGTLGTLSFETRFDQEARDEEDRLDTSEFLRAETAITLRRALTPLRTWWSVRGFVRKREDTAVSAGGSTELYLEQAPLGSTIHAEVAAFTQQYSEGQALHARGQLKLSRRFEPSDTFNVIPGFDLSASYLNTTPEIVAEARREEQIDPDVYNLYRYDHRLAATPRLGLRWLPLQDFVATATGFATLNENFGSLDTTGANLGVRELLPIFGETLIDLGYRPAYRFADANRPEAYWRHDFTARLEFSLWSGTAGRFAIATWYEALYASARTINAFGISLRFDLTRHRGLADFSPDDAPFSSLVEHACYAPLDLR